MANEYPINVLNLQFNYTFETVYSHFQSQWLKVYDGERARIFIDIAFLLVCGEAVVRFNDTVRDNVAMIKSIFVSVSDKGHPIVSKVNIRKKIIILNDRL